MQLALRHIFEPAHGPIPGLDIGEDMINLVNAMISITDGTNR
jgi:hypothetical protein